MEASSTGYVVNCSQYFETFLISRVRQRFYGVSVKSTLVRMRIPLILPRLSSYLFDITGNATYHNAASLSMAFIQSHLYDIKTMNNSIFGYVIDDCNPDTFAQSSDSGIFLEALSVFAHTTGNDTLAKQYV